ncbi:MAG: DUF2333 family protein [Candidatus Competibacteraceae bacterium]|jgi:hypothetical protein|nr:DUF2333 family protein [Candidatus Competibacteraceae bacterium]
MSARTFFGKLKNACSYLIGLYNPKNVRDKGVLWTLKLTLVTYIIVVLGLMFYWSREPGFFDIQPVALEMAGGDEAKANVPGFAVTAALIKIADTLLNKPGGYLSNDLSLPSYVMDNMPSWEFGVLTDLREATRALRNEFSRAQSQSEEDKDLMAADAQFHFDPNSWLVPPTEMEYKKGVAALQRYLDRLSSNPSQARFFVRADNLNAYLVVVEKRLGSLAHRLSSNVPDLLYTPAAQATDGSADPDKPLSEVTSTTPWMEIDNVFFEARGYVWALLHMLKAVEIDFAGILESKRARPALQRIIHKLKNAEHQIWSPLIMNNNGFGIFTNHSLIMASYISRANAAIIDLRILLMQG